jgi:hypothetical protein
MRPEFIKVLFEEHEPSPTRVEAEEMNTRLRLRGSMEQVALMIEEAEQHMYLVLPYWRFTAL